MPRPGRLGRYLNRNTMDRVADYVALAIAIHAAAVVWVNITPTPKDNERLSKYSRMVVRVYRIVEILAGIVSSKVKR